MNTQTSSIQPYGYTIRSDAVLTNAYVPSSTVDLTTYDSVIVHVIVGTAQASKVCNTKFQWSLDGTNFADETVDTATASTAGTPGTQPYSPYIRVIDIPMDTAGYTYVMRARRMGVAFRVAVKSDATTTGTISIKVIKASNYN